MHIHNKLTQLKLNVKSCIAELTKCLSFNSWTILDVHSPGGKISVLSLKSFKTQSAAHCLTLSFVSGDTNSLGTSLPTASTISSLPIFAIHCSARQTLMGLRLDKSFLMLWIISLISSLFALTRTEIKRYPWGWRARVSDYDQRLIKISRHCQVISSDKETIPWQDMLQPI